MPLRSVTSPCPDWAAYRGPDGAWRPSRPEGLARVIARAGYGTRPRVEDLIRSGRVTVGGRVVRDPGRAVGPDSEIHLDGHLLCEAPRHYLLLNKPAGLECHHLREQSRWIPPLPALDLTGLEPAGRLDGRASGLLLLSNDLWWNDAVCRHTDLVRGFEVQIEGRLSATELDVIRAGLSVPNHGAFKPLRLEVVSHSDRSTRVRLDVRGVPIRLVRGVFKALRHQVLHLSQVMLGPVAIDGLASGRHRGLTIVEIRALAGLDH